MDSAKSDRVLSLTRSAKSSLISVPYDPLLYGEDFANKLNTSTSVDGLKCGSDEDSQVQSQAEGALGSGGDFISVTKSFPFEMLVETKVCGPCFVKNLKRKENKSSLFEGDSWEKVNTMEDLLKWQTEEADNTDKTRDEITFLTEVKEDINRKPLLQNSHGSAVSCEVIASNKNNCDRWFGLVNDDDYAHLPVREQLKGRLVLTDDFDSKANLLIESKKVDPSIEDISSDPIMVMQRDHALKQYEPLFQEICSKRKKTNVFTSQHVRRKKRRSLLDSVARGIRKRLSALNAKKNMITGVAEGTSEDIDLTSILFEAIDVGEVSIIRNVLSRGALIEFASPYSYGRTPFQTVFLRICKMDAGLEMNASMMNYEEILDILFSHGCDINKLDRGQASNGWAPIHYASVYGKLKRIEWLFQRGVAIDTKTKSEQSPLMLACQCGRFEIAFYLIEKQANFRECDCSGKTVLHYAAMSGNKNLLQFLVQCGAVNDKLKRSVDGETPLSICDRTCQECSEYLQKAVMIKQRLSCYIDKMVKDGKFK